ncbi:transient receptor potential cation channel subfamily a member 1 [Gigaspora margarita]|uniref:Transient receptor potential cation channel subfamily a member 1 n=1 Tax=Gigaspora margarita TaxID=4874 RepID=A0A8H4EQJ2_GIGMA|nr:transient receptor potential cation channel subfamily a member 1 [Gigaspora margarita]
MEQTTDDDIRIDVEHNIRTHDSEIMTLICSPNLKYMATMSKENKVIIIWNNEVQLKPCSRLLAYEITNILGKHELVELSDDGLIVLIVKDFYASDALIIYDTKERQQILILGDTETKEKQYANISHYICESYVTDIHCTFLYNGNFMLLYKTLFGLYKYHFYSVLRNKHIQFQSNSIYNFFTRSDFNLNYVLLRNGWMLITKRGYNGTFYFLWNMETATFEFEIFGEYEGLGMEHYKTNKSDKILAIWHNGLETYSTQTGIMISKENYQDQNDRNWQINFICPDQRFAERLLISNSEDSSKVIVYLLDPYSLKLDRSLDIHLNDEFTPKIIRVYNDKIIRTVNNQILVHDIFQNNLVERLRSDLRNQNNIHSLNIIEDILEKINNKDTIHDLDDLDDEVIELLGHQNSWKYYKESDQLLMFRNEDITQPVIKSNLKKTNFTDLRICGFICLSNDDLIVICDHYHNDIYQNISFVLTTKDETLQMRYFFSINNLKLAQKNETSEKIFENIFSEKYFNFIFNFDRYRFFGDYNYSLIDLIKNHIMDTSFFLLHYQALLKEAITHHKNEVVDMVFKQYMKLMKDDTSFFLLHSQFFLKVAIMLNKSEIVDMTFKHCMKLIKDDPANINILKIITSLLPELYDNYPAYINRFLSQTSLLLSPNQFYEPMHETSQMFPHTAELHIFEHTPISKTYFFFHYYFYEIYDIIYNLVCKIYDFFYIEYSPTYTELIRLVVPLPKVSTYDTKYSFWKEILGKPSTNCFIDVQTTELYSNYCGEALLTFKWEKFGKYYYCSSWFIYTFFLIIFSLGVTETKGLVTSNSQKIYLWISFIIGCLLLLITEIRQFIWDWKLYVTSPWNLFDIGALLFPVVTSIYWLSNGPPPLWAPALSCLFLYFKFLFFLRAFETYNVGLYLAIMAGVVSRVFTYLLILGIIIIGFAHSFYILLQSSSESRNSTDVNTNLYSYFDTSLLAVYLLMIGDDSSLSAWDYRDNPILVVLMITFSIFTILFMLNLFIGLLSNAIQDHDNRAAFLLQKAKILAEIELFYLFPQQRRWRHWFPDNIYYYAPAYEIRNKILELKSNNDLADDYKPIISDRLLELLGLDKKSEENVEKDSTLNLCKDTLNLCKEILNLRKDTSFNDIDKKKISELTETIEKKLK